MKKEAGLWIDHREAVVVFLSDDSEETRRITSSTENQVRASGASDAIEGHVGHLNKFYDEVMDGLGDVESLLIFGPGEAKLEFQKHLEAKLSGEQTPKIAIETVDKLTDNQITAKVRQHFRG